jgi:hypothetical protein
MTRCRQCRFCVVRAVLRALFSFYWVSSVPHACTIPKGALGLSPLILIFASDVVFSNHRRRFIGFLKFSIDSQRFSSFKFDIWPPTTQQRCFVHTRRKLHRVRFPLILLQAPIHLYHPSGTFPCHDGIDCCPPCTTPYVPLFDETIYFFDRYSVEIASVTMILAVAKDV